ncbi:AmpG family muropeptide MFS transporter [Chitinasiproducens palmae]|uniref:MFS transporter, PAT family, beta-lactamase induction signal transducer AmpG n=1 Tax=Chitinasiproducens palmae TaxID=1770053 RepID=A0A1H2PT66_9BURK|nr:AmpG family muropeptide MFS transporter [Chitinasiproducens palmae]SDV50293.1 MFS transporter, PAT family, beta-lactamase induction signal transducer AmpG [Chitinasiproducens palmae]
MQNPSGQPPVAGWRALVNGRMLICVFLGFMSGLPLFTSISLLQAWLRSDGVDLRQIGLFALIQFPYTWKFVWAPLMDRFVPSFAGWRPGRRRGWMLLTEVLTMVTIAVFGMFSPTREIWLVAALSALLAFFSASLDIVVDAYRRELLSDREQGLGTAIHVNAYKVAGLVPGALSLVLADHLPWSLVFPITAAFMLPGILMTLVISEPDLGVARPRSLHDAIVLPFREFVGRNGLRSALLVLAFIFLYKLGDSMATALATSFYLDLGFTKTDIGLIAKTSGFWASIAGGLIGGVWLIRLGIARGLWIFGVVQLVAVLGFAWLAHAGASQLGLALVIGLEAFSAGLGTAAFTAYIASTTDPRYTATQFALFTSLASVPRTFANAGTGYIVAQVGWFDFFLVCAALGLPGLLLLPKVAPWSSTQ